MMELHVCNRSGALLRSFALGDSVEVLVGRDEGCDIRIVSQSVSREHCVIEQQGEDLVLGAREHGLATAVVRLSNVYGTTDDHHDRVVPAFARGAAEGRQLRVDGRGHTFDFTHLDDTVDGLVRMIGLLEDGEAPPPVHFLTGRPTTLGELAELAVRTAGSPSTIRDAPPRSYDVSHFYGDPARARSLLGWEPTTAIEEGVARLVAAFQETESA